MVDILFGGSAPWFTGPALLGTGFLLLQIVMGEIGGDLDADFDDPGSDARWLSLQSVAAFMVGFGWIGLAALRLFDLEFGAAAVIGAGAGVGVAWMMIRVTALFMKLQSDANVSLPEIVGLEGAVVIMIPPAGGGSGRISLVIHESQHEFPAVQEAGDPIHTHARVRVIHADESAGTVTVAPA